MLFMSKSYLVYEFINGQRQPQRGLQEKERPLPKIGLKALEVRLIKTMANLKDQHDADQQTTLLPLNRPKKIPREQAAASRPESPALEPFQTHRKLAALRLRQAAQPLPQVRELRADGSRLYEDYEAGEV
jgi:hypothetical protein